MTRNPILPARELLLSVLVFGRQVEMGCWLYSAAVVGLLVLEASALAISEPTKRPIVAERDSIPAPTQLAQLFDSFRQHGHLGKRADTTDASSDTITTFTATIASDKTCGYISGSAGNAVTCDNEKQCVWEEKYVHGIMCGIDNDATIKRQCIDKEKAENTDICDDLCQSNAFYLLCTEKSAAYCRTYAYPNGVVDFRCASTEVKSVQSVLHTYSGQKYSGFTTTTFAELTENLNTSLESSTDESATSTDEEATTTTDQAAASTTTADSGDSGGGAPLGAIIGGAIGGFVALAAVVILAIWLFRRNKNKNNTPPPPPPPPPEQTAPIQQTWVDPNSPNKSGIASPVQSEWRQSMMTMPVSSVSPGTGYGWGNQSTPPQQFQGQQGGLAEMSAEQTPADPVEMSADPAKR